MAVLKTVISSALVEPNKDVSRSQSSQSANKVLLAVVSSLTVDVEISDWWRKKKSNCMLRGVVLFLRVRHC